MARVKVDLTKNTWTKILTNVTSAKIYLRSVNPNDLWIVDVATGAAAPTDGNSTGNPFDLDEASPVTSRETTISNTANIDVYLFCTKTGGQIIADAQA